MVEASLKGDGKVAESFACVELHFILLLLTALITFNVGLQARYRQREVYKIFPKDIAHAFG